MPQRKATNLNKVVTLKPSEPARFMEPIEEDAGTIASNHAAELRGISSQFPGVEITVSDDWGTWYADDGCDPPHEAPGMGLLALDLRRCRGGTA